MKLFLASSLDKTISLFQQKWTKSPEDTNVLFISNAADPYLTDKFWIRWDREAFGKLGFKITEIDLRETTKEKFAECLATADILHMCGGSVLYLISLIKKQDLQSTIIDAVKNNRVLYSGTSAGSMIVSEKLDLCTFDQEELNFVKGMTDFPGLGFVNFLILPHCNQEMFVESNKKMIEHLPECPQVLMCIQDSQVVWVEDGKMEILSV